VQYLQRIAAIAADVNHIVYCPCRKKSKELAVIVAPDAMIAVKQYFFLIKFIK